VAERYPGSFGFEPPRVVANFVSTLDGVVAIPGLAWANRLIADEKDDDRFLMGLLRASADVVLIGSGTLQGSAKGLWTPESTYPDLASAWVELRRGRGQPDEPPLAIVTGSGMVDVEHPAFGRSPIVLTTEGGARNLEGRLPGCEIVALGEGPLVDIARALAELRSRGHQIVAVEAGPHVIGSMLREQLVDELFLTLSPLLAGRDAGQTRYGLVEGHELMPELRVAGRLAGVRRSGEHLFLRYELS
jgi:riboflavin biosynthesis pyrimidine reductase